MFKKFLKKKYLIPLAVGATALFLFAFFGPPDLYSLTSSPEFCASCHVMEYQHDAWLKTGLHRKVKCVDCHLPNDNFPNHALKAGRDQGRGVFFRQDVFRQPDDLRSWLQNAAGQLHALSWRDGLAHNRRGPDLLVLPPQGEP